MYDKITGNVDATDEQIEELSVQLQISSNAAISHAEGELATRALESWRYYYGELPEPLTKGSSKWVDRSVWEACNGTLQELISVFTSGEDATRFCPRETNDAIGSEGATKMVNDALLIDNPGYQILHDAFKEATIVRNSFIKRYWSTETEVVTENFHEMNSSEFNIYIDSIAEEDVVSLDVEEDQMLGTVSGTITYSRENEGVKVEYIPSEQIAVDPSAPSIAEAKFFVHHVRKTKGELLDMGFDAETVHDLPATSMPMSQGSITSERNNNMNSGSMNEAVNTGDEMTDSVELHENYMRSSVLSGEDEILQIFSVNGQILEINRVNDIPFETFTCFPIPGSIYGESVTDVTKDIQDLNTSLVRGIVDNVMNANFKRYLGIKGQYDRRSLLDNRPGGVVEVSSPTAISPFPYHPLPQGVSQLLEYTEQKKEQRTGVTRLGQGLDANVFKNDNAFGTVNMMMTAAQNRMRMVARNVAETGMKRLMLSIYRLIRENGKQPISVETAKGIVTLYPNQLPKREQMVVAVAVGANERRERAQTLAAVAQTFESSAMLSRFMQPENAYYLGTEMLQSMGIFDVQNYLTPLENLPEQKPSPMDELQVQSAAEQVKQAQATTQKILSEIQAAQRKFEFEQLKAADEFKMRREESLSSQDEAADKMSIEERKLEIMRQELLIKQRELDLREKEILIEAQLEAIQKRNVSLRAE